MDIAVSKCQVRVCATASCLAVVPAYKPCYSFIRSCCGPGPTTPTLQPIGQCHVTSAVTCASFGPRLLTGYSTLEWTR